MRRRTKKISFKEGAQLTPKKINTLIEKRVKYRISNEWKKTDKIKKYLKKQGIKVTDVNCILGCN